MQHTLGDEANESFHSFRHCFFHRFSEAVKVEGPSSSSFLLQADEVQEQLALGRALQAKKASSLSVA